MRDATECVNSIAHGLFAAIKAIFSNQNDLKLIMNYIQTIASINENINKIKYKTTKIKQGLVTGLKLAASMPLYKRFIQYPTNISLGLVCI